MLHPWPIASKLRCIRSGIMGTSGLPIHLGVVLKRPLIRIDSQLNGLHQKTALTAQTMENRLNKWRKSGIDVSKKSLPHGITAGRGRAMYARGTPWAGPTHFMPLVTVVTCASQVLPWTCPNHDPERNTHWRPRLETTELASNLSDTEMGPAKSKPALAISRPPFLLRIQPMVYRRQVVPCFLRPQLSCDLTKPGKVQKVTG